MTGHVSGRSEQLSEKTGDPGREGPALGERRALFTFRTCRGTAEAVTRVKGSRFLALLEPCPDRTAAENRLEELREEYRDASHVCWAWRLSSEPDPGEASSDAGEPSGTAGVPILSALRSAELRDVLGVVVRWFGGTKLGRGGLIRAYREAMAAAVGEADLVESVRRIALRISMPVERVGGVHRVLSAFDVTYLDQVVTGDSAAFDISVPAGDADQLGERIRDATGGEGEMSDPGHDREGSASE